MASGDLSIALCFCWMTVIFHLTTAERGWSQWYSSDSPGLNGVDNETVSRIALVFDLPCRPSEVEEAECREIGTNESFSDLPQVNGNALLIPCNASGLVCRDEDQLPELGRIKCFDYEIRILCGPLSDDDRHNEYYDVVGSNGGFIALAAGGSVVLPLVFVLVIQLRKSKREERRRQRQERQAAEDLARAEAAAHAADAPPAYDELFGSSTAVSVISGSPGERGRSGSAELLMQNEVRSQTSSGSSSPTATSANTSTSSFPFNSVITSLAIHSSGLGSGNTVNGVTNLVSSQSQSSSGRRESAESMASDTASQSSTDALLPATSSSSSSSHVIHQDPPPAYDGPSGHPSSVTIVSPVSTSSTRTNNSSSSDSTSHPDAPAPRVAQRRFLGMHLSIFDLMAVIYPDPVSTPPPSYDDALKILGVHKQPEIQVT